MGEQSPSSRILLDPFEVAQREPGASAAEAAYRTLRRAIVTMVLPPATRLSEQELADMLAISRQPVREALLRLRDLDLVVVRPKAGSLVARISTAAVESAQFVREAIECQIVQRAAASFPAAARAALHHNLEQQAHAARARDADLFFKLDEMFHRTIAEGVGCGPAWNTIESAKAHMDRVRFLSLPDATPPERLIAQHRAILDGITARDADAAAAAMQTHLREIIASLPVLAARHPGLFDDARAEPDVRRTHRPQAPAGIGAGPSRNQRQGPR